MHAVQAGASKHGPGRHRKKFPRQMLREIHRAETRRWRLCSRSQQHKTGCCGRTVKVKLEPHSPPGNPTSYFPVDTTLIKVEPVDGGYDEHNSTTTAMTTPRR